MSVTAAAMPSRITSTGTDRHGQAPPVPIRRIHSLPDRTVSEQSQLDDILTDLLNDPLFVDGTRTYEISNDAEGTYATIASNHGNITTSHHGSRRQLATGSPVCFGGSGGGGGSVAVGGGVGGARTVVSWQTNQTGPKRTVAVTRHTVDRPTADSVFESTSSRRIQTESSVRPGSAAAGRRVGESSSSYESRRTESRNETTTTRRDGGGFDGGSSVRIPPSPPTRRRAASHTDRAPSTDGFQVLETNATHRSCWDSTNDFHSLSRNDDPRGGRSQSVGRRGQNWRHPTDVAHSDTEDYFRSSERRGWESARHYNDPYLSDDMSVQQHQRRSATSARTSRSGADASYETKRCFYVSGIERPASTTRQTKYTFSVSPQRSMVDEDELVAGRHGGLFKPPSGSVLPPLRGPSSREAVMRASSNRADGSQSPSLDDLERSLQSVQLLLDTKKQPVVEQPLVGRNAAQTNNFQVEEIEEEVISLQPIGPGVQNLEPDDPTRLRSMTPAFPTLQRGVSPFPMNSPVIHQQQHSGFRTSSWSDVRPQPDISPVSHTAGQPNTVYRQMSANNARTTAITSTPVGPAASGGGGSRAQHDLDALNALLDFDSASSPPPPAPAASGTGRLAAQSYSSPLCSPADEVFAGFPHSPQRGNSESTTDAIYHTPRQLTGYGGSGHQHQTPQTINAWSGGTGPTVAGGYQIEQAGGASGPQRQQQYQHQQPQHQHQYQQPQQQQQQQGGAAPASDLGLFGALMDDGFGQEMIQPQSAGQQQAGPPRTPGGGGVGGQLRGGQGGYGGQSSTLPPTANRYPGAVEESTLTRSHQPQQHASGGSGNGLFTMTSRTATLSSPQPDKGRSVSPSDMALKARLQSRLESRSPGLTGRTSPSLYTGHSRTNSLTSLQDGEVIQNTPRFVRDSSKYWHKPNISREEAISLLRDKPPGSFVVRNSNTFQGAFGLAMKVAQLPPNIHTREGVDPQSELVRHFLIEPTSKGVRLKGCSNEPVFGSLAALVYQHTITPLALPCKLVLPEVDIVDTDMVDGTSTLVKTQLYQQGAACNVLYISSIDMESLTGPEALTRAITAAFPPGSQQNPPATTVVHFKVSSQGITLTDSKHKLFFRRHYPINTITFCGVDAKDRRWTLKSEDDRIIDCKIFGFVARKPNTAADNTCHIFGEMDPNQPANAIVNFLTKIMIGQGHLVKT